MAVPARWSGPGLYAAVVCRTRVIDDACRDALAGGISRVVIVGAGMDTRPYRMPETAAAQVWEFDLASAQRVKKATLTRALGALPGSPTGHHPGPRASRTGPAAVATSTSLPCC
ncbi:class I SAM-dependent methyltransferase [Actinoplanes cyaneus]|uniref:class I SAM-dependent methyltransferase n=1 Tax=Actinoplanes cyaneus TaxID=52696 RepID=UPI001945477E|nr:class I SAM-dependent methyltransferase [Actinoplanes cyaneus]MCW2141043.1 methyltransferase, TIGR00027 family [Actinoplanes cyaneus]